MLRMPCTVEQKRLAIVKQTGRFSTQARLIGIILAHLSDRHHFKSIMNDTGVHLRMLIT